nr:immunoglobulin heavy chain junction region [Macaca mulatta]MOV53976.1 immunoglobulin heavy chain junction region [Macaca mulatta]MOV56963.1 immunoglobulin heavy chain junction region [Macaca mulatta]MOV57435.1 immunoglobulin heavy chain junction region [Macaca mulatta]
CVTDANGRGLDYW